MGTKQVLLYGLSGIEPAKELDKILDAIRDKGWSSILVTDKDSPSSQRADFSYQNPYWDYQVLKQVSEKHSIGLCILGTDFSGTLVARLNQEFNLPGLNTKQFLTIADKLNLHQFLIESDLASANIFNVKTLEDIRNIKHSGRLIIKPSRSTANITEFSFGYRSFDDKDHLLSFLDEKDLAQKFLHATTEGTALGRYFIQEKVEAQSIKNIQVFFSNGEVGTTGVVIGEYCPEPFTANYTSTYGPVPLLEDEQLYVKKMNQALNEKLRLDRCIINYDLVRTADGRLLTLDINPRVSGTYTVVSNLIGERTYSNVLSFLEGESSSIPRSNTSFLRKILIPTGNRVPRLKPGYKPEEGVIIIGEHQIPNRKATPDEHRFSWPLEALITKENLKECWLTYDKLCDELFI